MKFFISGGSGYLGRNLIRILQQEDCTYKNYDLALGYDILDEQRLFREMKGCDAVFHLAALKSVTYCEKNIEEATVTRGGIATDQMNPKTMESTLVPGLYFVGEMIHVDGPCGGYHLQMCWSTGAAAGCAAAENQ